MHIETFPNFHAVGSGNLQSTGKYVSIAPGSDVECCLVGKNLLGVGQVVPFDASIRPVRGSRDLAKMVFAATPLDLGQLQLTVWDACEVPVVGPRAPTVRYAQAAPAVTNLAISSSTAYLACTLPFYGRKQGTFYLLSSMTVALDYIVRGVKLRDPTNFSKQGDTTDFFTELALGSFSQYNKGTPITQLGTDGVLASLVQHVGGEGDDVESFDLLELWVWSSSGAWPGFGAINPVYALGESFGERNR